MTSVEGWYPLVAGERQGKHKRLSTLCVRGCEAFCERDEEAFPPSVFGCLGPAFLQEHVPLDRIHDSTSLRKAGFRFLLLEFSSCSQLLPFMSSLSTLFHTQEFDRIFLVSHSSCAPGTCLLPSILQALALLKLPFKSLTIWGTHLSDQVLRVTVTLTYACSYIAMYRATHHPPLHDLSFFEALSALHSKLYPNSKNLSHRSICDFQLHSPDLISLNLTDCEAIPDAIHAWLTSNVLKLLNLQSIVLSNNGIDDTAASNIISALRLHDNSKLRILDLSHNNIKADGFTCLASALAVNTALSHLYVGGNPTHCRPWTTLITVLGTTNRTLEKLQVDGRPAREASAQVLCDLIKTNTVLKHLEICASYSFSQPDVVAIFKALEENKSLTSFALPGCEAVDGVEVYEAILDAVARNDSLENLDLRETPIMQNPKHSSAILRLLQQQDDIKQQSCLRHLPKVSPSTSRVFLCGEGLAGKTTLCWTMTRVLKPWQERYLKDGSNALKTKLFGQGQTKGIQVTHLECDKISVSLWDFAGQREYHAFHDWMFPLELGPSLFLMVCNLMINNDQDRKSDADIKREVEYWLSYISSNTRKLKNKIPNVILIFSHKDKLPTNIPIVGQLQKLASQWRTDYKDFTRVLNEIFIINGRNKEDVKDVAQYVIKVSEDLLKQCPPIYDLCNEARHLIGAWNYKNPDKPWLHTSEFFRLAKHKFKEIIDTYSESVRKHGVEELLNAVCYCLHDSGHVIFFQEVSMVFLNPGWFCEKFMGGIIDRATKSFDSIEHLREGDAWNRKDVEQMLEDAWKSWSSGSSFSRALKKKTSKETFSISDLVQILLKLDFCYELDPGNPDSRLFIPSALQHSNHSGPLSWVSSMQGACIYLGRRLMCEDEKHTFLTPGFFPALQVHLRKSFPSPALYSVVRNVIRIHVDRMEILIELCEKPVTFIDILARSCKSSSQTILFLRENLIETIQRLQGVTGHWQGIDLVEGIVRPVCVRRLTPCTERLGQFVLVNDLRRILLNTAPTDIRKVTFPWPESPGLTLGVEHLSIKELLGKEDFSQVLGKVLTQITHFSKELNLSVTPINSPREAPTRTWKHSLSDLNSNSLEKHVYSIAAGIRSMVYEIKVDVKDLKSAVKDLVKQGKVLAPQIQCKISGLLMSSRGTRLPRLFVLMKGEKLITRFTPGLTSLNLQFMCEHEGGLHVPLNQPGYDISIVENATLARILPYLKYLLSAIFLGLKVGAHVVGGVGNLVPDLSSSMDEVIQATGLAIDSFTSLESPDEVLKCLAPGEPPTAYSGNTNSNFLSARAWVEEFLEKKGCVGSYQIIKTFGLFRKELADGRIVWLCQKHINECCNQVDQYSERLPSYNVYRT